VTVKPEMQEKQEVQEPKDMLVLQDDQELPVDQD